MVAVRWEWTAGKRTTGWAALIESGVGRECENGCVPQSQCDFVCEVTAP